MAKRIAHGTRVLVKDSRLYTGRTGILGPISDDPEDIWDYTVVLDDVPADKVTQRRIGVSDFQVEKLPN